MHSQLCHNRTRQKDTACKFQTIQETDQEHGSSFAAVSAKQAAMLIEGYGKKITPDRGRCSILYSFVSDDMLEMPNGIPLGINMISKGPVIFDIGKRTNYNIAVIGKSGSGKSFTVKILLNRLHQKFPDSHIYVIDPMGEYGTISKFFGMDHLNITKNDEQWDWIPSFCWNHRMPPTSWQR